jgi:hypothetical protein
MTTTEENSEEKDIQELRMIDARKRVLIAQAVKDCLEGKIPDLTELKELSARKLELTRVYYNS